jgi:hypothetical protein
MFCKLWNSLQFLFLKVIFLQGDSGSPVFIHVSRGYDVAIAIASFFVETDVKVLIHRDIQNCCLTTIGLEMLLQLRNSALTISIFNTCFYFIYVIVLPMWYKIIFISYLHNI